MLLSETMNLFSPRGIRFFTLVGLGIGVLLAGGCASWERVKTGAQERLGGRPTPHAATFMGTQREVYDAARAAMEKLGFVYQRGGAAVGNLVGVSSLDATGSYRRTSQQVIEMEMDETLNDGEIEVQVWLSEILETDPYRTTGRAGATPLRDSSLYDGFFRALQVELDQDE